ncbi:MAG: chemotaxis protein CheW [Desulforegulaceae bacterium]|nr:chemotaxis protein CheW [Desulforegulaceae bacterium]
MIENEFLSKQENSSQNSHEVVIVQLIKTGEETFAVPRQNLSELIRIVPADIKEKIAKIGSAPVLRLRGELVPVVDLAEVLGLEKVYLDPETGESVSDKRKNIADRRSRQYLEKETCSPQKKHSTEEITKRSTEDRRKKAVSALNFAIVTTGILKYAVLVDGFGDSLELEVRPPGKYVKKCKVFSGVTLKNEQRPILILDIEAVGNKSGLCLNSEFKKINESEKKTALDKNQTASLLTFKNSKNEYFAVSLDNVERIEKIKSSKIEKLGQKKVIKYKEGVLPVFELSNIFKAQNYEYENFTEVVVFKVKNKNFGITAKPPIDIQEIVLDIDDKTLASKGIKGSLVINGKTSLLIDIEKLQELLEL